jgi:long-chain acyl-CoA synthetase
MRRVQTTGLENSRCHWQFSLCTLSTFVVSYLPWNSTGRQATVCCVACRKYRCTACDTKAHVAAKHHRVKVEQMNAYIDLSAPAVAGQSDLRRSWMATHGFIRPEALPHASMYHYFQASAKKYGANPCLGRRTVAASGAVGGFAFSTYAEIATRIDHFASGLAGLELPVGAKLGIYAQNRTEWVIAEHGAFAQNLVTVPLYETFGPDAAEYVLRQGEVVVCVCSHDKVAGLCELSRAGKVPSLKHVIVLAMQAWEKPVTTKLDFGAGLGIMSIEELERKGRASPRSHRPPRHSDMATFCYTSGTTGDPKGAMLTHANLVSNISAVLMTSASAFSATDVHISFLPLAHMFERLCIGMLLAVGGAAGFFRGDVTQLLDDVSALQPTIFAGVPRLYNRIYDKIRGQVKEAGGIKQSLFDYAYASKQSALRESGSLTHWLWDPVGTCPSSS